MFVEGFSESSVCVFPLSSCSGGEYTYGILHNYNTVYLNSDRVIVVVVVVCNWWVADTWSLQSRQLDLMT